MRIQIVKIHPEGDGITALYINGRLFTHGDHYHNKIDNWISGFLQGLRFAKDEGWCVTILESSYYTEDEKLVEDICEMGGALPDNINEIMHLLECYTRS